MSRFVRGFPLPAGADVQAAPYFRRNLASSILPRKSRSLKTRVEEGTSDSPTCGRGKMSLSKITHFTPALPRYEPIAEPAGPPPMMPTSNCGSDSLMLVLVYVHSCLLYTSDA